MRDPFVFANKGDSTCISIVQKSPAWDISAEKGGVQVLKSRDLKTYGQACTSVGNTFGQLGNRNYLGSGGA